MAVREIREMGDPILNKTCKEVKEVLIKTKAPIMYLSNIVTPKSGHGINAIIITNNVNANNINYINKKYVELSTYFFITSYLLNYHTFS